MKSTTTAAFLLASAAFASAAISIDGTKDSDYGGHLAVQSVQTQFGDNFSELNAAYGNITGSTFSLMLTGNLEDNFNKLSIFIDSTASGTTNVLDAAGNDGTNVMDGMTFDTGFTPDYHIIVRRGGGSFDIDFANLATSIPSSDTNLFGGSTSSTVAATGTNTSITAAYNATNTGGVAGGTGSANTANALAATVGLELQFDLSLIGSPTSDFRVAAMVNGSNHNFLSNQILGGLPGGTGNLGGDGNGNFTGGTGDVDFNDFAGDQFFTVPIPEPSAALLGSLGLLTLLRRRRA